MSNPQRVVVLKPINVWLHATLTFCTGGVWGLVWLAIWLYRKGLR